MSTDCNCLLLLSGSGLENVIFSVFPERRKASAFKGIPTNVYVWSTVTRSARGAFLRPHLLIMKQYLILQLKQEEILHCFCLWTPLVMAIHEFPFTHCSCLLLCPWPHCSSWFWQMWGFGVGLFHLCILCHFCPSNRANLFQQTRTGHSLPWKSWPEGLALAFGWPHERQWCLLPSPMSDHGFWDTFLSKPPDEGENLLLWECWACQIWNEMGLSTVNINSTNPVMGGLFSLP